MKLAILADDFTGALDTSVQFSSQGISTVLTSVDQPWTSMPDNCEVLTMDLQTRHLPPTDVYRRVYRAAEKLRQKNVPYLYIKTDSGMRGNVGAALAAAADCWKSSVYFVPAYPKTGRTVVDGALYVDGKPVSESVFGEDLFNPVRHDRIADIIAEQTRMPVVEKWQPEGAITEMFRTALALLSPAEVYLLPTGEPKISDAQQALEYFRKLRMERVIGLGGGSVLDVAKTVAALGKTESTVKESIGSQSLTRQVELILVPTTAGTGSEATRNCLFIDDQTGIKCALIADACLPDRVVLDPVLTRSLPPAIAAFTGVDALCHCAESYISCNHSPISRIWSMAGIELIREWLPKTIHERDNDEARQQMADVWSFVGTDRVKATRYKTFQNT